ncbi:MAG TPA: formate hydrogenlyase [Albitalea sp.]|nr:formate hydrogenlyase [Albitalea sp.]
MWKILRQMTRAGIATEPAPPGDDTLRVEVQRIQQELLDILGQALAIRQVDTGSCNGCELEIHALNNPYYNLEGLGIKFVASPRHADMLLVTGPVSRHMEVALRRTYDATPEPKLVVAIGDCGCGCGIFGESYATLGSVARVIPVDVAVPGCPPPPLEILRGILTAVRRRASGATPSDPTASSRSA